MYYEPSAMNSYAHLEVTFMIYLILSNPALGMVVHIGVVAQEVTQKSTRNRSFGRHIRSPTRTGKFKNPGSRHTAK